MKLCIHCIAEEVMSLVVMSIRLLCLTIIKVPANIQFMILNINHFIFEKIMFKHIFIICFLMTCFIACNDRSNKIDFHGEAHDFQGIPLEQLANGEHKLFVSSDKPVHCAIYLKGLVLTEADSIDPDNVCILRFHSDNETLKFFITYRNEKGNFKYHAVIL